MKEEDKKEFINYISTMVEVAQWVFVILMVVYIAAGTLLGK